MDTTRFLGQTTICDSICKNLTRTEVLRLSLTSRQSMAYLECERSKRTLRHHLAKYFPKPETFIEVMKLLNIMMVGDMVLDYREIEGERLGVTYMMLKHDYMQSLTRRKFLIDKVKEYMMKYGATVADKKAVIFPTCLSCDTSINTIFLNMQGSTIIISDCDSYCLSYVPRMYHKFVLPCAFLTYRGSWLFYPTVFNLTRTEPSMSEELRKRAPTGTWITNMGGQTKYERTYTRIAWDGPDDSGYACWADIARSRVCDETECWTYFGNDRTVEAPEHIVYPVYLQNGYKVRKIED